MSKFLSHADRFWSKVKKSDDCWEWQAAIQTNGYGVFTVNRKANAAHRWIYQQINGAVGFGIHICHHCDNKKCVRPDHLFAGTRSDNMRDCARKGRNIMQRHPERSSLSTFRLRARGEDQANSVLTESDVAAIRSAANNGARASLLAVRFSISAGQIRKIIAGKAWAHSAAIACTSPDAPPHWKPAGEQK